MKINKISRRAFLLGLDAVSTAALLSACGGSVYLSGIQPGDQMIVSWGADEQCTLTLPASIPTDGLSSELKLLCQTGTAKNAVAPPPTVGTPDDMEKKNS